MESISHPFPPVVDPDCRVLILGSFPSVKSREYGFFYGHPQNRFWALIAAIFNEPSPSDISAKKALLLRHNIALWDVISACQVLGSSDSSIRNAIPVDISKVTDTCRIKCVICNGNLAGKLYRDHLMPITGIEAVVLPSTSPANAAWSMERLITVWKPLLSAVYKD